MKITLAQHSGFCMGVRNAILRIVSEINDSEEEILVYGPLIHNPQTIDVLHRRGMRTITSLDPIDGKRVVIRTHGVPVGDNRLLKKRAGAVINLTCPRVARVQSIIKKYSARNLHTIITGDRDHAEVTGLMSYASSGVTVISDVRDVDDVPPAEAYLLVSQTTFDRKLFTTIVSRIRERFADVTVFDTICDSTRYRQDDVFKAISGGIDTLVVVGGKNSANTKRLAQIGRDNNIRTFHVETEAELVEENFADSKSVLVTAGTSTPGWIINNVLERLYSINFKKSNFFINAGMTFLELIVRTNILASAAAFFITLITFRLAGIPVSYELGAISFLYIFSMYSVNNYFERDLLRLSNPYKYAVYGRYGSVFLGVSILLMAISIIISTRFGPATTALIAGSYSLGFIYSTKPVKGLVAKIRLRFTRKLYNSKLVTCFGWIIISVLAPMTLGAPSLAAFIAISGFVFALIFLRTALMDLIAFQGDLILGRETLPIMVGTRIMQTLSMIVAAAGIALFSVFILVMGDWRFLFLSLNIIYYVILLLVINRLNYLIALKYEMLVDLNFALLIIIYALVQII
ncbi:MAG: 4-hydroxy-3-methylbut-2-enyl diphosphate reductase [Spirochaetes bacterium]|nr:4-hydroxy-3-methylbut-2-enyl diphosphate reductase [Spirochaetota bacterium]